ncbi:MAG TPA: flavin reductase [Candidatus Mediterraneibacter norwichensis]|nr:flavin reductase [Candidatus Mediterraneibacter norwichensis]
MGACLIRNAFTVGIADEKKLVAADYVGIVSGHDAPDKIEKSGFHTVKSEFVDAPVIEELPISLECRVEEINQYNATLRIVAEIVNVSVDEKVPAQDNELNHDQQKAEHNCKLAQSKREIQTQHIWNG